MPVEFVWVTQGKQQHQAILLEEGEFFSRVKWWADQTEVDVPNADIEFFDQERTHRSNATSSMHSESHPEEERTNDTMKTQPPQPSYSMDDAASSSSFTSTDSEDNSPLRNFVRSPNLKKSRKKIAIKKNKKKMASNPPKPTTVDPPKSQRKTSVAKTTMGSPTVVNRTNDMASMVTETNPITARPVKNGSTAKDRDSAQIRQPKACFYAPLCSKSAYECGGHKPGRCSQVNNGNISFTNEELRAAKNERLRTQNQIWKKRSKERKMKEKNENVKEGSAPHFAAPPSPKETLPSPPHLADAQIDTDTDDEEYPYGESCVPSQEIQKREAPKSCDSTAEGGDSAQIRKPKSCFYAPLCSKSAYECGGHKPGKCSQVNNGIISFTDEELRVAKNERRLKQKRLEKKTTRENNQKNNAKEGSEPLGSTRPSSKAPPPSPPHLADVLLDTDDESHSDDDPFVRSPERKKRKAAESCDIASRQPKLPKSVLPKRKKSTARKTSAGPGPQPQQPPVSNREIQRTGLIEVFRIEKKSSQIPVLHDNGTEETVSPTTENPFKNCLEAGDMKVATNETKSATQEQPTNVPASSCNVLRVQKTETLPKENDTPDQSRITQYSGKSSAYLQNLAEICYSIVSDRRWQGLFKWEHNDDLRAVEALQRMYTPIPRPVVNVECRCILCIDDPLPKPHRRGEKDEATQDSTDNALVTDELTEESLYLYSRMFYRKGPWFRFDDIYHSFISPLSKGDLNHHLTVTLPLLFQRISKLIDMGLIRGFENELECGNVCDKGSLFRADELSALNGRLGGKQKTTAKGSIPSFAVRVSTQRTLVANQSVPLIFHAKMVIAEKFVWNLVEQSRDTTEYATGGKQRCAKLSIDRLHDLCRRYKGFPMFFRLMESPVYTLRRVVRLYLCANSGPGEMRGTGSNGWQSVNEPTEKTKQGEISPPCSDNWHHVKYPGLEFRFGLQSFCFMNSYRFHPANITTITSAHSTKDKIFASHQEFRKWETCVELRANVDYLTSCVDRSKRNEKAIRGLQDAVDVLDVSSDDGRGLLISIFAWDLAGELMKPLSRSVNQDISSIPSSLRYSSRLLCFIGILSAHVLNEAIRREDKNHPSMLRSSPWLRHLSWHACLAAIIWDIVQILEQQKLYQLAVRMIYLLFHGELPPTANRDSDIISSVLKLSQPNSLAQLLFSRRSRTKIFDRLLIDVKHIHIQQLRAIDPMDKNQGAGSISQKWVDQRKKELQESFGKQMGDFCVYHIRLGARFASLGFSSLRGIAKRLKAPLPSIVESCHILEAAALGLRIRKGPDNSKDSFGATPAHEWKPLEDESVANSIVGNTDTRGTRTSFVGYEDGPEELARSRSLNVEEYAKELYRRGLLPQTSSDNGIGGWDGWPDDEGRILRSLFRIICGAPVLGTDYGCCRIRMADDTMQSRIFLTPYHQAPADLHVSYQKIGRQPDSAEATTTEPSACKGIYLRRKNLIFSLCEKLRKLSDQELSDLVFDSMASRLDYMHQAKRKDPVLDRDLLQLRTLSAVAAGYGGAQLAAAFTCLLFDYRTYSGGLPDLQLIRAVQRDQENNAVKLVDLEWIGESFSPKMKAMARNQQAQALLFDDNDEYLGCSKDSTGRWRKPIAKKPTKATTVPTPEQLPERLQLVQNGSKVWIECMSVEVKSQNDTLSSRQVDWLNILDQNGYSARVCKFRSSQHYASKKLKTTAENSTGEE